MANITFGACDGGGGALGGFGDDGENCGDIGNDGTDASGLIGETGTCAANDRGEAMDGCTTGGFEGADAGDGLWSPWGKENDPGLSNMSSSLRGVAHGLRLG